MEDFFAQMLKSGGGTETATVEQIRFLSPVVDDSGQGQAVR